MNNIQGIIFDCDGVLFESKRANLAYYNTVLDYFHEPAVAEEDRDKAHLCHTAASKNVLKTLLGEKRAGAALDYASTLDYRQFIPFMQPEPGMVAALQVLASSYPLAVATNRGYSMPEILEHFNLSEYFSTVVTSRDVPNPKPAPDMLLEASRRLAIPTDLLLFVGDSELDQLAANSAGIRFANYRGTLSADINLNHHDELVRVLEARDFSIQHPDKNPTDKS